MYRDQLLSRLKYLPSGGSSGEKKRVEREKTIAQDNSIILNIPEDCVLGNY